MKFIGVLALVAKLALGDFCYQAGSFAMNLRQVGTRLQVTAKAPGWVGFGVPKNPDFHKMNLGNYVVGGGGQIYDMILTIDRNIGPNMAGTMDVVPGTGSTSTIGGMAYLSFERELNPGNGYLRIDTSRPFNILWAYGPMTAGSGWRSIGYHGNAAGAFRVNMMSSGNCDSATLASLQAAGPYTAIGQPKKATPKKAAPKKASVCSVGQTVCSAALQMQGLNCIIGQCVNLGTAVPIESGRGADVFYMPATATSGFTSFATACGAGQVICTASLQASGVNCALNSCVSGR